MLPGASLIGRGNDELTDVSNCYSCAFLFAYFLSIYQNIQAGYKNAAQADRAKNGER